MSNSIHQQMTGKDILVLIILSILWGGSFFFVEILVDYLPPLSIVTARVGLAAILLWTLMPILKTPIPKTLRDWTSLFVVGVLNNALPFCLIVWGQTQISSGLASILNATAPFFTVLVAGALLADERLTKGKIAGVLVGLIGTVILIGPDALSGVKGSLLGQLAVIGAALSYAVAATYSRRFKARNIQPLTIATGQVTMAALMLLPLALIIDRPWTLPAVGLDATLALFGLAIFSTVIAYFLYFKLIASAGASNAALVAFLIPISAILLGVLFLGESFTGLQTVGMGLIGTGLLIMDGRIFRFSKSGN